MEKIIILTGVFSSIFNFLSFALHIFPEDIFFSPSYKLCRRKRLPKCLILQINKGYSGCPCLTSLIILIVFQLVFVSIIMLVWECLCKYAILRVLSYSVICVDNNKINNNILNFSAQAPLSELWICSLFFLKYKKIIFLLRDTVLA